MFDKYVRYVLRSRIFFASNLSLLSINLLNIIIKGTANTFKLEYNDHLWDPQKSSVVNRRSLFGGHLCKKKYRMGPKNSGLYRQVVAIRRWSLTQV